MFGWVSKRRYETLEGLYENVMQHWDISLTGWKEVLNQRNQLSVALAAANARIAELTQPRDAKGHFVSRKAAVMDEIQDRDCSFIERNG
jgi:hypothetical protein